MKFVPYSVLLLVAVIFTSCYTERSSESETASQPVMDAQGNTTDKNAGSAVTKGNAPATKSDSAYFQRALMQKSQRQGK